MRLKIYVSVQKSRKLEKNIKNLNFFFYVVLFQFEKLCKKNIFKTINRF